MNTQHMDELSRAADKLTKDKIEKVTPVPLSEHEKNLINIIHVLSLPTITEIYCEIGVELLKYIAYVLLFLCGWFLFSHVMDIIFA